MKITKILVALMLAMCMVLSLASCGDDDSSSSKKKKSSSSAVSETEPAEIDPSEVSTGDSLEGTWKYTLDVTKLLEAASEQDAQKAEIAKGMFAGISYMDLYVDLTSYGTYKSYISDELVDKIKDNYIDTVLQAAGMSEDDFDKYLQQQGMTREQFISTSMGGAPFTSTGTYRVDGNKLYRTKDGETEDTSKYDVFELNGNQLIFTELYSGEEDSMDLSSFLPMVYTRQG